MATLSDLQAQRDALIAEMSKAESETKTVGSRSHSIKRRSAEQTLTLLAAINAQISALTSAGQISLASFKRSS